MKTCITMTIQTQIKPMFFFHSEHVFKATLPMLHSVWTPGTGFVFCYLTLLLNYEMHNIGYFNQRNKDERLIIN